VQTLPSREIGPEHPLYRKRVHVVEGVGPFHADGVVGVVEIAVAGRRHDGVMAGLGGLASPANPIHDGGIRREAALENFAPADQAPAFGVEVFLDAPDEVTLGPARAEERTGAAGQPPVPWMRQQRAQDRGWSVGRRWD